jgi:hypothetical protein
MTEEEAGVAVTVSVTEALASLTVLAELLRLITGKASSSVIVTVCLWAGVASVALSPPLTLVISTITVSAGSLIESPTLLRVAVPVVLPAAIVIVLELSVKSVPPPTAVPEVPNVTLVLALLT